MVFQCPCGAWPINRVPRGHRPLSRTILVVAAVSSINTSRAGSSMPCSRFQRLRARATSTRSCSVARRLFFKGDVMSDVEPRHRAATAGDPSFGHRSNHFVQRQIRLLGNQTQQPLGVLLQRRDAPPAWLCRGASILEPPPHPVDHRAGTHVEAFRRLMPRRAPFDGFDRTPPQVIRIWLRHSRPPKNESMGPRISHQHALGNPPIQPDRDML